MLGSPKQINYLYGDTMNIILISFHLISAHNLCCQHDKRTADTNIQVFGFIQQGIKPSIVLKQKLIIPFSHSKSIFQIYFALYYNTKLELNSNKKNFNCSRDFKLFYVTNSGFRMHDDN